MSISDHNMSNAPRNVPFSESDLTQMHMEGKKILKENKKSLLEEIQKTGHKLDEFKEILAQELGNIQESSNLDEEAYLKEDKLLKRYWFLKNDLAYQVSIEGIALRHSLNQYVIEAGKFAQPIDSETEAASRLESLNQSFIVRSSISQPNEQDSKTLQALVNVRDAYRTFNEARRRLDELTPLEQVPKVAEYVKYREGIRDVEERDFLAMAQVPIYQTDFNHLSISRAQMTFAPNKSSTSNHSDIFTGIRTPCSIQSQYQQLPDIPANDEDQELLELAEALGMDSLEDFDQIYDLVKQDYDQNPSNSEYQSWFELVGKIKNKKDSQDKKKRDQKQSEKQRFQALLQKHRLVEYKPELQVKTISDIKQFLDNPKIIEPMKRKTREKLEEFSEMEALYAQLYPPSNLPAPRRSQLEEEKSQGPRDVFPYLRDLMQEPNEDMAMIVKQKDYYKNSPRSPMKSLTQLIYYLTLKEKDFQEQVPLGGRNNPLSIQDSAIQEELAFLNEFNNDMIEFQNHNLGYSLKLLLQARLDGLLLQAKDTLQRLTPFSYQIYHALVSQYLKAKAKIDEHKKYRTFLLISTQASDIRQLATAICRLDDSNQLEPSLEANFFKVYEFQSESIQLIHLPDIDALTPESELAYKLAFDSLDSSKYCPLVVINSQLFDMENGRYDLVGMQNFLDAVFRHIKLDQAQKIQFLVNVNNSSNYDIDILKKASEDFLEAFEGRNQAVYANVFQRLCQSIVNIKSFLLVNPMKISRNPKDHKVVIDTLKDKWKFKNQQPMLKGNASQQSADSLLKQREITYKLITKAFRNIDCDLVNHLLSEQAEIGSVDPSFITETLIFLEDFLPRTVKEMANLLAAFLSNSTNDDASVIRTLRAKVQFFNEFDVNKPEAFRRQKDLSKQFYEEITIILRGKVDQAKQENLSSGAWPTLFNKLHQLKEAAIEGIDNYLAEIDHAFRYQVSEASTFVLDTISQIIPTLYCAEQSQENVENLQRSMLLQQNIQFDMRSDFRANLIQERQQIIEQCDSIKRIEWNLTSLRKALAQAPSLTLSNLLQEVISKIEKSVLDKINDYDIANIINEIANSMNDSDVFPDQRPYMLEEEKIQKIRSFLLMANDFNKYLFEKYALILEGKSVLLNYDSTIASLKKIYDQNLNFIKKCKEDLSILDEIRSHFIQLKTLRTIHQIKVQTEGLFSGLKLFIEKLATDQVKLLVSGEDMLTMSIRTNDQESKRIKDMQGPASFISKLNWIKQEWNATDYNRAIKNLEGLITSIEKDLLNRFKLLNHDLGKNIQEVEGIFKNVLDLRVLRKNLFIEANESELQSTFKLKVDGQLDKIGAFIKSKIPKPHGVDHDVLFSNDELPNLNLYQKYLYVFKSPRGNSSNVFEIQQKSQAIYKKMEEMMLRQLLLSKALFEEYARYVMSYIENCYDSSKQIKGFQIESQNKLLKNGDIGETFQALQNILTVQYEMRQEQYKDLYSMVDQADLPFYFEMNFLSHIKKVKNSLFEKINDASLGQDTVVTINLLTLLKHFAQFSTFLDENDQKELQELNKKSFPGQSLIQFAHLQINEKVKQLRTFVQKIEENFSKQQLAELNIATIDMLKTYKQITMSAKNQSEKNTILNLVTELNDSIHQEQEKRINEVEKMIKDQDFLGAYPVLKRLVENLSFVDFYKDPNLSALGLSLIPPRKTSFFRMNIPDQIERVNQMLEHFERTVTAVVNKYQKEYKVIHYQQLKPLVLIQNLRECRKQAFIKQDLAETVELYISMEIESELRKIEKALSTGKAEGDIISQIEALNQALELIPVKFKDQVSKKVVELSKNYTNILFDQKKQLMKEIKNKELNIIDYIDNLQKSLLKDDSEIKEAINKEFIDMCAAYKREIVIDPINTMQCNYKRILQWFEYLEADYLYEPVKNSFNDAITVQRAMFYQTLDMFQGYFTQREYLPSAEKATDEIRETVRNFMRNLREPTLLLEILACFRILIIRHKIDMKISDYEGTVITAFQNILQSFKAMQSSFIIHLDKVPVQLDARTIDLIKQMIQALPLVMILKNPAIQRSLGDPDRTILSKTQGELFKLISKVDQVEKLKSVFSYFITSVDQLKTVNFIEDKQGKSAQQMNEYFTSIDLKLQMLQQFPQIEEQLVAALLPYIGVPKHPISHDYLEVSKARLDSQAEEIMLGLNLQVQNISSLESEEEFKLFGTYLLIASIIQEKSTLFKFSAAIKEGYTYCKKKVNTEIETIAALISSLQKDDVAKMAQYLICLQKFELNCEDSQGLHVVVQKAIKNSLDQIQKNYGRDNIFVFKLNLTLKEKLEGYQIVKNAPMFKGVEIQLFNEQIARNGIDEVLEKMLASQSDHLDVEALRREYGVFQTKYKAIVAKYLTRDIKFKELVNEIHGHCKGRGEITAKIQKSLPELVALIFALWTLLSSEHFFNSSADENKNLNDESMKELKQPHAAQVVSIFRIFGIGFKQFNKHPESMLKKFMSIFKEDPNKSPIVNNLVQILTGEGKSITLATVGSIFALLGFDVSVACYSEYLSMRDYEDFERMFDMLKIKDSIVYGTFNSICERQLNKRGNIRDMVLHKILRDKPPARRSEISGKKAVLLIDEVDVFFSKSFFNQVYIPMLSLNGIEFARLLDKVWDERVEIDKKYQEIRSSEEFKACKALFKAPYDCLAEEALKDIISDMNSFMVSGHEYKVHNGEIGYQQLDMISTKVKFGYKTVFANYQEYHNNHTITQAVFEQNRYVQVNCAEFSYSEIPNRFRYTFGVSGTLKALSEQQLKIIRDVYNIRNMTYSPSVYGASKLDWVDAPPSRIKINNNETEYINDIVNDIKQKVPLDRNNQRAVLVVFENMAKLEGFMNSPQFSGFKNSCNLLTESLNTSEKQSRIFTATKQGSITLMTAAYGRGTDFICRDQNVIKNNGIHVILTFWPEQLAEFEQIKGRTARQGQLGSFAMVLLENDLTQYDYRSELLVPGDKLNMLEELRDRQLAKKDAEDTNALKNIEKMHEESLKICEVLAENGPDDQIKKFLFKINKGPVFQQQQVKTLILMDATGSMKSLINNCKNSITTMFDQMTTILIGNGYSEGVVLIQLACYRSYNSKIDMILQASPWEQRPAQLRVFMDTIKACQGWAEEAIEIGLDHANQEADSAAHREIPISQVFVIGDVPPTPPDQVANRRKSLGEGYWATTRFNKPTNAREECLKLKAKGIEVHTFYVKDLAKTEFKAMAALTGGSAQFLNVNDPEKGQKTLIDKFSEQILLKIGNSNGAKIGEKLVADYKKTFNA